MALALNEDAPWTLPLGNFAANIVRSGCDQIGELQRAVIYRVRKAARLFG